MLTRKQVLEKAVTIQKQLGPNWKIRVWENFGWHANVSCCQGYISIQVPEHRDNGRIFQCMISKKYPGAGIVGMFSDKYYSSPKAAVKASLKILNDNIIEWQTILNIGKRSIGVDNEKI